MRRLFVWSLTLTSIPILLAVALCSPLGCCLQVHPAPGPEEVNWQSLWYNHQQRVLRGWLTAPFAIIVVLLPVSGLTSAISMLNSEVRSRQLARVGKQTIGLGQRAGN
jgi:hypothetical protein